MELEFSGNQLIVRREEGDVKIYSESKFFNQLRKVLVEQGYDVIKKLMTKDGHLVSDGVYYVRSRNVNKLNSFMAWDSAYQIRFTYEPYNRRGEVVLEVER